MRRFALSLVSMIALAAALGIGTNSAAAQNWSGWYIGANAGGNWGSSHSTSTVTPGSYLAGCAICVANVNATGDQKFNTSGFTGGVQGGYNWQFGNWVAGVEADFVAPLRLVLVRGLGKRYWTVFRRSDNRDGHFGAQQRLAVDGAAATWMVGGHLAFLRHWRSGGHQAEGQLDLR